MAKNVMQMPPINIMPKAGDAARYGLNPDPLADRSGLRHLGILPTTTSLKVGQSIIGVGYETLDRDTFNPSLSYRCMQETGTKWARLQTGWLKCEKKKGVYDFSWLDRIVDSLLAIGIQPWFSVGFGNPLYTPVKGYETWEEDHPGKEVPHAVRGYVGEVPLYHGREAVRGWENYLTALTRHFTGRVKHYEIWNEPNTAPLGFWRTYNRYSKCNRSNFEANCARDYVELVKVSARSIRKVNPKAVIIGGAISLTLDACFYIRNLTESGITKYIDALSYHPYGGNPEFGLLERFNNLRSELDSHNGKHITIWQGEAGYPTKPHGVVCSGNEYVQAKYLTRRFAADFRCGVEMSSYFMVMDKQGYNKSGICGYGVLDTQGHPKPAYTALQSMGYLFDSAERAENLYLRVNIYGAPLMSHLRHISMSLGKFRRKGVPVFYYYVPENPELSMEPGLMDLQVWVDRQDKLEEPVLIDPIRRSVYLIDNFESCTKGFKYPPVGFDENVRGFTTFHRLPFTDYPLFLSDRAVLKD
jgi:polysaccharide biosynthesis protein PslG